MVNDYLKKFEFNYESSATGSFLVVSTDAGENVLYTRLKCSPAIQTKISCPWT